MLALTERVHQPFFSPRQQCVRPFPGGTCQLKAVSGAVFSACSWVIFAKFKWAMASLENVSAFVLEKKKKRTFGTGFTLSSNKWDADGTSSFAWKLLLWYYTDRSFFLSFLSFFLHTCDESRIRKGPIRLYKAKDKWQYMLLHTSSLPCIPPTRAHACLLAHKPVTIWFLLKITCSFNIYLQKILWRHLPL